MNCIHFPFFSFYVHNSISFIILLFFFFFIYRGRVLGYFKKRFLYLPISSGKSEMVVCYSYHCLSLKHRLGLKLLKAFEALVVILVNPFYIAILKR